MLKRCPLAQAIGLAGWLAVVFSAAAVGAVASVNASGFYAELSRPGWAPPASVFGPVWSALYLLMGIVAWLVWRNGTAGRHRLALAFFVLQLFANAFWSWLFFAWRNGAVAFAEVLLLLFLVALTMVLFWRVSRLAGLLMLPYFLWVSFASALTWAIWQANPTVL
jgi:translocator protein